MQNFVQIYADFIRILGWIFGRFWCGEEGVTYHLRYKRKAKNTKNEPYTSHSVKRRSINKNAKINRLFWLYRKTLRFAIQSKIKEPFCIFRKTQSFHFLQFTFPLIAFYAKPMFWFKRKANKSCFHFSQNLRFDFSAKNILHVCIFRKTKKPCFILRFAQNQFVMIAQKSKPIDHYNPLTKTQNV